MVPTTSAAQLRMVLASLAIFCFSFAAQSLNLAQWEKRPKLMLVIVIDQFRADYLTKLEGQFLPSMKGKQIGGFRYLMEKGAYFPFAQYPTFQCMTCPGHAMILTGAPPASTGIPLNEWFDVATGKMIYCAENSKGELSPERLRTSTVGDELKMMYPDSKVVSLALKDRAAIMLAGHKADTVLWMDSKTGAWTTSAYYGKSIPTWAQTINSELQSRKGKLVQFKGPHFAYSSQVLAKESFAFPLGTEMTVNLALTALKEEKLGLHPHTDLLTMSLSNHDYLGHQYGFGSAEIEALTLAEDQAIAQLLQGVKAQLGSLDQVVIALTADHGVAPLVETSQKQGLAGEKVDLDKVKQTLEAHATATFGSAATPYWAGHKYFHYYLNPETLKARKLQAAEVLQDGVVALRGYSGLETSFTAIQYQTGVFPPGLLGDQLRAQYIPGLSGDLIFVPRPFVMDKDSNNVTHITGYSYDRQVPIVLLGAGLKAGLQAENVDLLRLAPTLSFLLGTVAPASSKAELLPVF